MKKKLIVITGLTASGKTKISIQLAKKINAEIICADSRIVYKDFDIVSAKPTIDEREGIIHHLIDIKNPLEDFSAGDFVNEARKIINETDNNIIISGGTWFYIKSLLDEFELIECSKCEKLRAELEEYSNEELYKRLQILDFKRAAMIHPNNRDKVIRSIELCEFLGEPVSEHKRNEAQNYDAIWFMPEIERQEAYERINKRVDIMLEAGLFEEWRKNKSLYPDSIVMKNTIGYTEFFDMEKGLFDFDVATDKIKQHTRNFAKRQLTYFKSRKDIVAIEDEEDILRYLKL